MNKEYETQVLDLDTDEIAKKLRELGAKEEPEVLQRRWVFDIDPCTKDGYGEWVRLRQVGDRKPAITYKNRNGGEIGATTEIEIEVENFDKAYDLLAAINFDKGRYYQENKRHKFVLKDIEFTIDTWPKVPKVLEIEAKSREKVHEGLEMLDLTGQESGDIGMVAIYHKYGLDVHEFKELKF